MNSIYESIYRFLNLRNFIIVEDFKTLCKVLISSIKVINILFDRIELTNNNSDDDNVRIRKPKRKVCAYCADKNLVIDYKQVDKLKKYVSEKGKILPRRVTGLCAKHQRDLTIAVKRARHIALLPFTME